jgi:putative transcriptional regulator
MAKTRKAKVSKSNYMSDEAFAELKVAFEDALAHERGVRQDLRVTRVAVPRPPKPMSSDEITRVRQKLNCSQAIFALMLNISPRTVQAWEQGARTPGDAALKLLNIAKRHPEVLLEEG